MVKKLFGISTHVLLLGFLCLSGVYAQDSKPAAESNDTSRQVEQREDSYRQQMELEDARNRERTYVDNTYSQSAELEKIDKLPEESRDNIRDQLVDIIMENGEWEPSDVLAEYPYQPTAAAEADSELLEQEQAAWDEQIEKYHEREASAFGSYRGPVPGPGNPTGQEGAQQGDGTEDKQGGQQGGGQDGGEGKSGSGSAGTYQPYVSTSTSSKDEVSTEGVSESALDFLKGGQMRSPEAPPPTQAQAQAQAQAQESADQAAQENSKQLADQNADQASEKTPEAQQESTTEVKLDLRGIIAIEDLDKLEGTEVPAEPEDPKN